MKCGYALVILSLLLFPLRLLSQDQPKTKSDSLNASSVVVNPHFTPKHKASFGSRVTTVNDHSIFHSYAGTNVINTLRGSVPSLSLNPRILSSGRVGLRTSPTATVIDGMPFSDGIHDYYNMNAFDFEKITVLSNPTSLTAYGRAGSNGAIFLQSKTGEGHDKPSIEFNSYNSLQLKDETQGWNLPTEDRWIFGQSVAYQQDFGQVDARVSYNYTTSPFTEVEGKDRANSFKINTGLEIGKFSARLVGDYRQRETAFTQDLHFYNSDVLYSMQSEQQLAQGNLFLQYRLTDWLKITSQHVLSEIDDDTLSIYEPIHSYRNTHEKTRMNNLMIAGNWKFEEFDLHAFVGIQREKWGSKSEFNNGQSQGTLELDTENTPLLAGMGGSFRDLVFLDLNMRSEDAEYLDNSSARSASAETSFVFSKLFMDNDEKFLGRVHSSYGSTYSDTRFLYPSSASHFSLSPLSRQIPPKPGSKRKSLEFGGDVEFLKRRVTLSTSYYKISDEDYYMYLAIPNGTNFSNYLHVNVGELVVTGWEMSLGANIIRKEKTRFDAKIIYYRKTASVSYDEVSSEELNYLNRLHDEIAGAAYPEWQGSLFTQFSTHGIFLNILLDARQGGEIILWDDFSNTPLLTIDGTYTKLRDIVIGYSFAAGPLRGIDVSLSGRNLIQFNDEDADIERYYVATNNYLKSVSLSVSARF